MTAVAAIQYLEVTERGEIWIADEDHVKAILALGPELDDRQFFTVRVKRGRYYLTAGKYIGVIPITPWLVLRVAPKVSTGRLMHILTLANESPLLIRLLERSYSQGSDLDVFDLLVKAFHREMSIVFQLGPIREYVRQQEVGQTLRGRPLFGTTMSRLWPRAAFETAAFERFDFNADNFLNQAIEYTIWHLKRVYPEMSPRPDARVMRDLYDAHQVFAIVTPDRTRSFLPELRAHLNRQPTAEPVASYTPLLTLCQMILDELGIDLEAESMEHISLLPMVIDMESVFQRLLFNTLVARAPRRDGLACWDTDKDHQQNLLHEPTLKPPTSFSIVHSTQPAKPDFAIALNEVPVIIGDAKYKSGHGVHDIYQAVAHANAYGALDVLLVYPALTALDNVDFQSLGSIGEVRVFVCRYPLEAADLADASDALFAGIEAILDTRAD